MDGTAQLMRVPPGTEGVLVAGPFRNADLEHVRSLLVIHLSPSLPDAVVDRLKAVACELVANVITHCGGDGRMWITCRGGRVYCQVIDRGRGIPHPYLAGWIPPDPADPQGRRGLWLARMFSDRITFDSSALGTTVTARFDIACVDTAI